MTLLGFIQARVKPITQAIDSKILTRHFRSQSFLSIAETFTLVIPAAENLPVRLSYSQHSGNLIEVNWLYETDMTEAPEFI